MATSTVSLNRHDLIDAVENRGVAIGQMFRHFNIMPRFTLHAVGVEEPSHIWREYTLEAEGVRCQIHERMLRRVFELKPLAVTNEKGVKESSKQAEFGDIMGSVPSLVAT